MNLGHMLYIAIAMHCNKCEILIETETVKVLKYCGDEYKAIDKAGKLKFHYKRQTPIPLATHLHLKQYCLQLTKGSKYKMERSEMLQNFWLYLVCLVKKWL